MHHIPQWALVALSPGTGIVIADPIHDNVPQGLEAFGEQRFAQGDPDVLHDEIPTGEIREIQVRGLLDRGGVLVETPEKWCPRRARTAPALPCPLRDSFADVDRRVGLPLTVAGSERGVRREWAAVVAGVDSRAVEGGEIRSRRSRSGE